MKLNKQILILLARVSVFAVIFAGAFWMVQIMEKNGQVQQFMAGLGYMGVLAVSFVSGLNLVVPIPAVAFAPLFIGSGLNMWFVLFFMTLGMTIADSVAYFLGATGRNLMSVVVRDHYLARLDYIRRRLHMAPLFVLLLYASFVPFPNEILVIPLAFMGYRLKHILLPLFLGNAILNAWSGSLVLHISGLL